MKVGRTVAPRRGPAAPWRTIAVALATVGAALLPSAVVAKAPAEADVPSVVGVDDVLRLLRERSPDVAAGAVVVDLAASDVTEAGLLPNPTLHYGGHGSVSRTTTLDGSEHSVAFEQPLLLAGQRRLRREVAGMRHAAAGADFETLVAGLAREARLRFVALLAAQERAQRLEKAGARLADVGRIVHGRALAGAMSRYDLARVDIEGAALETRVAEARTDVDAAARALAIVLGLPSWSPRADGRFAPADLAIDADHLWPLASERLPELETARREQRAAERAVELARRERWPVPVFSAGPYVTTEPESYALMAGIAVPLPLFDRGQAGIERAAAEERLASRTLAASEARARASLQQATELLGGRRASLERFERDAMARLPDLQRMAEEAYRHGHGGILDLLDVVRSRAELEMDHVERLAAVLEAEVEFLAASGAVDDARGGGARGR